MTERIKQLVEQLNRAAKAYYQEDREILSNQEYGAEQSGEGGARKPDSFLG